jgi:hypothetical protein
MGETFGLLNGWMITPSISFDFIYDMSFPFLI